MAKGLGLIPERAEVTEISKYYGIMGKMIKEELMKLTAGDYQELKAMTVQKKIDTIVNNMNKFVFKWSKRAIPKVYKDSFIKTKISLSILDAQRNNLYDKKKHIVTIERFQEATAKDYVKANLSIKTNIATYIHLLRQASKQMVQVQAFDLRDEGVISGLLDESIRAGESRQTLMALIRKHFGRELYEQKFININGRNYNLISYAENVARTRLRIIQSEATKNLCEEYDNDLVEISDHGTICEICKEFEGNVYSINGDTPGYDIISEWPPYHPQCEHSAAPSSEAAISWGKAHPREV